MCKNNVLFSFVLEDIVLTAKCSEVDLCWIFDVVIGVASLDLIELGEGALELRFESLVLVGEAELQLGGLLVVKVMRG